MTTASLELIELIKRDNTYTLDSNGERVFDAAGLRTLASRCIDAAQNIDEACPLEPYLDNIVVREIDEEGRMSGGGIAIPDNTFEVALRGVVVARGPNANERLAVGDVVAFSRNAGTGIKIGDSVWRTMKSSYALTKIKLD